jgi:UDPglucose 6-dehydrogenase
MVRTTIPNAELAKIALNAFVTMKISFANTLAEVAERIPGGDVDVVSRILGLDSRIGRKYLAGGLGYGGPCFPRDNKAFSAFAGSVGCKARLPEATHEENRHQVERITGLVKQKLGELTGRNIAVLGLTYKPDTDVIDESAAIAIAGALLRENVKLSVYDPAGMENARAVLGGDAVKYAESVEECLRDTELCIIATPWKEFMSLRPEDLTKNMRHPALLDCWRVLRSPEFGDSVDYLAIGLGFPG